ncbi:MULTISPECIES: phytoene/squalene synthase family protein [Bacillaceae]|uniref:4,4'-diapophytoene synthase n=1 Tax=Alkalicoccobacillus plakortidis TaxID=444060 RepID=A0A9D5DQK9_9BACI|nr:MULTISPECIES: phytoene/squalene synthase family protein [Bacillaceae]KQL58538.1 hypothetical protein AN965_02940 [Alkalicoccobacillus plakortidis]
MTDLDDAYALCYERMKTHSATFSKAFHFLPVKQRRAVWAIYAFCRQADDIVDDEGEMFTKRLKLKTFEQQFDQMLVDKDVSQPEWLALKDVFNQFHVNPSDFKDQLKGQAFDLRIKRIVTIEELEQYSYFVASTVGLMLLPILAPKDHHALRESAIALGKGMQLTNILRDVGEDLQRGKIYLPIDLMNEYGVTEEQLKAGVVDQSFIDLWEAVARKAEHYYDQSLEQLDVYPNEAKFSVYGATIMYREILQAIRMEKYDVFSRKIYVDDQRKKEILAELRLTKDEHRKPL